MDTFLEQFDGAKLGEGRTLTITNAQKDMKIACAVYRQAIVASRTIPADVETSDTVTLTVKTACASHVLGQNLLEVPATEPTCAHEAEPAEQGLMGMVEVFLDTIVICTLTALVILVSGVPVPYGTDVGGELTTAAFSQVYGAGASAFLAGALCLFAAATILGWGTGAWQDAWRAGGERCEWRTGLSGCVFGNFGW